MIAILQKIKIIFSQVWTAVWNISLLDSADHILCQLDFDSRSTCRGLVTPITVLPSNSTKAHLCFRLFSRRCCTGCHKLSEILALLILRVYDPLNFVVR